MGMDDDIEKGIDINIWVQSVEYCMQRRRQSWVYILLIG